MTRPFNKTGVAVLQDGSSLLGVSAVKREGILRNITCFVGALTSECDPYVLRAAARESELSLCKEQWAEVYLSVHSSEHSLKAGFTRWLGEPSSAEVIAADKGSSAFIRGCGISPTPFKMGKETVYAVDYRKDIQFSLRLRMDGTFTDVYGHMGLALRKAAVLSFMHYAKYL